MDPVPVGIRMGGRCYLGIEVTKCFRVGIAVARIRFGWRKSFALCFPFCGSLSSNLGLRFVAPGFVHFASHPQSMEQYR